MSIQPHEINELCNDLRIQGWFDEALEEVRQALTRQAAPVEARGEEELREALTELRFAAHTFGQLTHAFGVGDNRKEEMQHLFVRFREDVSKLEKHLRAKPAPVSQGGKHE